MSQAAPLIGLGVQGIMGAFGAHSQAAAAEKQAQQQSAISSQLMNFGKDRMSGGQNAMNVAQHYYTTLASGSRGAINNMLAPQMAQMHDQQHGAEQNIMARMHSGANRDSALARVIQQGYGQRSLAPMEARTGAMGSLAKMGTDSSAMGMQAMRGASGPSAAGYDAQKDGLGAWSNFGSSMYKTMSPYMTGEQDWSKLWGGNKSGGGGTTPGWGVFQG